MVGSYRLRLLNTDDSYIQSVSTDNSELPNQIIAIEGQNEQIQIKVQIGVHAASISGSLALADKVGDVCGIVLQSLESGEITLINGDKNRHFHTDGLAPGHYRLFAWEDLNDVPYLDPTSLARYENQSTNVLLEKGMLTVIQTPLRPLKYSAGSD